MAGLLLANEATTPRTGSLQLPNVVLGRPWGTSVVTLVCHLRRINYYNWRYVSPQASASTQHLLGSQVQLLDPLTNDSNDSTRIALLLLGELMDALRSHDLDTFNR